MGTYQKVVLSTLVLAAVAGFLGCGKREGKKQPTDTVNQTTSVETKISGEEPHLVTIIQEDPNVYDLTPKLERVKDRLYQELTKGELDTLQYWQIAHGFLCEEGIIKGSFDATYWFVIPLAYDLTKKLPVEEYQGVQGAYYGLEGVALSSETQEDINKLAELERMTREYLEKEIGDSTIFISEYRKIVKDYLMNQTELPNMTTSQGTTISVIGDSLLPEFDIKSDPEKKEKIGEYDTTTVKQALENL